jgi:PAT family beta-lactamase induction signal transducer AmpG
LRFATGTLLYLAQGLAQGLFFVAIPSWLAVNGQPVGAIGSFIAAISLPWSLKFFIGAVVDRYAFLPMGRRRAWLVGAQACLIISLIAFAIRSPLPSELATIIIFGAVLSAMMAGGAALVGYFLEYQSFPIAMIATACLFSIPAFAAILIRERPGEKLFPWNEGQTSVQSRDAKPDAWWPVLRETFRVLLRRDPLLIIGLCVFYGMHQGIIEATLPAFAAQEMQWGETRYSSLAGIGYLISSAGLLLVGGWVTDKIGPATLGYWTSGIVAGVIAIFIFVALASTTDLFFSSWYLFYTLIVSGFYLCMVTLGMRVCEEHVAATSYALMMGSMALGMMLGAGSAGLLDQIGGYAALLTAAIVTILSSAAMGLGLSPATGGPVRAPGLVSEPPPR